MRKKILTVVFAIAAAIIAVPLAVAWTNPVPVQIKAMDLTELRNYINAVRADVGLSAYSWTDPTLATDTPIKLAHFNETRIAIAAVATTIGASAPSWSYSLYSGSPMRATDLTEPETNIISLNTTINSYKCCGSYGGTNTGSYGACPGTDDSGCGTISCAGWYTHSGYASSCYNKVDITSSRCEGINDCKDANTADCSGQSNNAVQYSCTVCKYIDTSACTGTTLGSCTNNASATACGGIKTCDGGGSCTSPVITYSGAATGTWDLSSGPLYLTAPGDYTIMINKTYTATIKGVAGGGGGGGGRQGYSDGIGGGGGGGGASNTAGVSVSLAQGTTYTAKVGAGTSGGGDAGGTGGTTEFRISGSTTYLQLTGGTGGTGMCNTVGSYCPGGGGGSATVGAGGSTGGGGGDGGYRTVNGKVGGAGGPGGGGGGGGSGDNSPHSAGGNGNSGGSGGDQSGGGGGSGSADGPGVGGTTASGTGGYGASGAGAGGGGGGGGGKLFNGVYYGGGGGGGGGGAESSTSGGGGKQGVLVIS